MMARRHLVVIFVPSKSRTMLYGRLGRPRASRVEASTDVEDEPVVGGVVGRRPS